MTTSPERSVADRARATALWLRDTGLGGFGFALVLLVALSGWSASFLGLHSFGVAHMSFSWDAAWLVPLTFDGAPAGLSIVVMRASIHGRSAILWRILIIAFTALSSWINYQHIDDDLGRYVASFMPPSAVILFEGLMSEVRAAAERRKGRRVRDRVHPLRWFFDRTGTLDLYRRHILDLPLPDALEAATKAPQAPVSKRPDAVIESAPMAPQALPTRRPESAMPTRPAAPRDAAEGAMRGAMVDLTKRPQSATANAAEAPPRRSDDATDGAPDAATETPAKRPATRHRSAPKAPRNNSAGRPAATPRDAARDAIKALYSELGRRPLESEMIAVLKAKKLPPSRQFANARRLEIEKSHPELAALGSDNVRPLTGTDS